MTARCKRLTKSQEKALNTLGWLREGDPPMTIGRRGKYDTLPQEMFVSRPTADKLVKAGLAKFVWQGFNLKITATGRRWLKDCD